MALVLAIATAALARTPSWLSVLVLVAISVGLAAVAFRFRDFSWVRALAVVGAVGAFTFAVVGAFNRYRVVDEVVLDEQAPLSAESSWMATRPVCQESSAEQLLVFETQGATSGVVVSDIEGMLSTIEGREPMASGEWLVTVDDNRRSVLNLLSLVAGTTARSHIFDGTVSSPSVSRTGEASIVVESVGGNSRLVHLDWKTADTRVLHDPRQAIDSAAISPDGTDVAWVASGSLYVANVDTFTPVVEIAESGIRDVSWSSDGAKLAFTQQLNDRSAVFIVDSNGASGRQVTFPSEGSNDRQPSWQDSCDALIYVHATGATSDLWMLDLSTLTTTPLTLTGAQSRPSYGVLPQLP